MSYDDLPIAEIKEELNEARLCHNLRATFTAIIRRHVKDFEHTFDFEWKEFVENVGMKPLYAGIIRREINDYKYEVDDYHEYGAMEYQFEGEMETGAWV